MPRAMLFDWLPLVLGDLDMVLSAVGIMVIDEVVEAGVEAIPG